MKNKIDCELSRSQRYWRNFRRVNQTGMLGYFQRWLRKKKAKGNTKHAIKLKGGKK